MHWTRLLNKCKEDEVFEENVGTTKVDRTRNFVIKEDMEIEQMVRIRHS